MWIIFGPPTFGRTPHEEPLPVRTLLGFSENFLGLYLVRPTLVLLGELMTSPLRLLLSEDVKPHWGTSQITHALKGEVFDFPFCFLEGPFPSSPFPLLALLQSNPSAAQTTDGLWPGQLPGVASSSEGKQVHCLWTKRACENEGPLSSAFYSLPPPPEICSQSLIQLLAHTEQIIHQMDLVGTLS